MKLAAIILVLVLALTAAGPQVENGAAIGKRNAPLTIEIFSDFQCPMCRSFHERILPRLVKDFASSGKAYIVQRQFPLSTPDHKYSRQAAMYGVASARMAKFSEVADVLFRNQQSWGASGRLWDTVVKVLTPDEQKLMQNLLKDPTLIKQIGDEVAYGKSKSVASTPTLIVTKGSRQFPVTGYALGRYELLKSMLDDLAK